MDWSDAMSICYKVRWTGPPLVRHLEKAPDFFTDQDEKSYPRSP